MPSEPDIVSRLRGLPIPGCDDRYWIDSFDLMQKAADEIDQLRALVDEYQIAGEQAVLALGMGPS